MTVRPFTLVLAAVVTLLAWQTWWLGPDARRVPLVVVAPLLALVGCQLLREARARGAPPATDPRPAAVAAVAWAAALPAAVAAFGMLAGPPLFVAAFMRLRGREAWGPTLALAVALAAFVWLLFVVLLQQSVPRGFVG